MFGITMERIKVVPVNDLDKDIGEILEFFNFTVNEGEKVLLKPNLVAPRDSNSGATTDIKILEFLIKEIKESAGIPIIGEGVGYEFSSKTFEILGIDPLVKRYEIEFVNFRDCGYRNIQTDEKIFKQIRLPEILFEVDKVINLPKLKTHMLTKLSISIKNLMGFLPLEERRKAHVFGLSKTIVELAKILPTDLTIIDSLTVMHGKGPAFGDKLDLNLLIAGQNNFCLDEFCCKLLNVDTDNLGFLNEARRNGLIPKYDVVGEYNSIDAIIPDYKAYRFFYWLLYCVDGIQSFLTKRTLIPLIINSIGTRPKILKDKCVKCKKCVEICPVEAIRLPEYEIDFIKCKDIRCLRCYDVCNYDAIKIKGFSKPEVKHEQVGD